MSKPTTEQKVALREQLGSMKPDQWIAMMQWILLQVASEQEYFVSLIMDEVDRRVERERAVGGILRHQFAHLIDVMRDLKLRLVPEGWVLGLFCVQWNPHDTLKGCSDAFEVS